MNDLELKKILTSHPDCVTNGAKLKTILLDRYPEVQKGIINVICAIVDSGIAEEMVKCDNIDKDEIDRWLSKLECDYCLTGQVVSKCISLWIETVEDLRANIWRDKAIKLMKQGDVSVSGDRLLPYLEAINCFEKIKYGALIYKPRIYTMLRRIYFDCCKVKSYKSQGIYFKSIEKCAQYRYENSVLLLGHCYKYGIGVNTDFKKAISCYRSIQDNNAEALIELGDCRQYGLGIKQNWNFAMHYYERAINLGDSRAKNYIDAIIGLKKVSLREIYGLDEEFIYEKNDDGLIVHDNVLKQYIGNDINISLPNHITEIAPLAFAGCKSIERIVINDNIEKLGAGAFYGCENLQSVSINSQKIIVIPEKLFCGCTNLQSVLLPDSVKQIDGFAFSFCYGLKKMIIPSETIRISEKCFLGCRTLENIVLPYSLKEIGFGAFYYCSNLNTIEYNGDSVLWGDIKGVRTEDDGSKNFSFNNVNLISNNNNCNVTIIDKVPREIKKKIELCKISLDDLGLTARTFNALMRAGIHTVGDIVNRNGRNLLMIKGLGHKGIDEVAEKIMALGLSLRND